MILQLCNSNLNFQVQWLEILKQSLRGTFHYYLLCAFCVFSRLYFNIHYHIRVLKFIVYYLVVSFVFSYCCYNWHNCYWYFFFCKLLNIIIKCTFNLLLFFYTFNGSSIFIFTLPFSICNNPINNSDLID